MKTLPDLKSGGTQRKRSWLPGCSQSQFQVKLKEKSKDLPWLQAPPPPALFRQAQASVERKVRKLSRSGVSDFQPHAL